MKYCICICKCLCICIHIVYEIQYIMKTHTHTHTIGIYYLEQGSPNPGTTGKWVMQVASRQVCVKLCLCKHQAHSPSICANGFSHASLPATYVELSPLSPTAAIVSAAATGPYSWEGWGLLPYTFGPISI